jgi:hypothetical protein
LSFPKSTAQFESRDRGLVRFRTGPRVVLALALLLGLASAHGVVDVRAEDERRGGLRDILPEFRDFDSVGVLELAPRLEILRVRPGEILGGSTARAVEMGRWSRDGLSMASFEIDTHLVRTLPDVWRMRVADLDSIYATNVRYTLSALDGTANALTNLDNPTSVIHASITPLAPRPVDGTLDSVMLEGGLVLDLDLRDVRTAGVHAGTLTVTLENY